MPELIELAAHSSEAMGEFRRLTYIDGYLPIEDHGLIGDGTTAALVGRDGSISWLCAPRFDSDPIFAGILDRERGGALTIDVGEVLGARHRYLGDTSILITELRTASGMVRVTDLMPLKSDANLSVESIPSTGELFRCIEVISGEVLVRSAVGFRGGISAERSTTGQRLRAAALPELDLHLECSRPFAGTSGEWGLRQGESVSICLRWNGGTGASSVDAPVAAVANTTEAWLAWLRPFDYRGPERRLVRRSAITIKLLDYLPNGALVAAPTASLPEEIGGERNWDYRYVWVRDAAFAVYALSKIGASTEAQQFLDWVMDRCDQNGVHVMYTIDGGTSIPERIDPQLRGYRESAPVRWGNGASTQVQHDVYGELVDCAYQWTTRNGAVSPALWSRLRGFIEHAARVWDTPDQGIWEVRSRANVQTYSAGMCHVALDRGVRMAERYGLPGDLERWRGVAADIEQAIIERAWSEDTGYFRQQLGAGHIDASILGLPLRRVIPATHPRMVRTVQAVEDHLGAGDGLVYRYRHAHSPDGLEGGEGAFVLCSFWMIDNLTLQGRLDEASDRFARMCGRVNALGLLPEQIDPGTGRFLGNFPQAFSHLGLISSGVNLERALTDREQGRT